MNLPKTVPARRNHHSVMACAWSLAALALLAACATSGEKPPTEVELRAQQRWDALLARDYDTAYGLLAPGFRSSVSRVDYEIGLRTRRVIWTSADVQSSECDNDSCTITTKTGYRVGSPVPGVPKWESTSVIHEKWVRTGGEWWYLPEP